MSPSGAVPRTYVEGPAASWPGNPDMGGDGAPPSSKTVAGRDEVNRQDHKLGRRGGHFWPSDAGGDSFAGAGAGAVGGGAGAGAADPESRGLWVSAKSASISF